MVSTRVVFGILSLAVLLDSFTYPSESLCPSRRLVRLGSWQKLIELNAQNEKFRFKPKFNSLSSIVSHLAIEELTWFRMRGLLAGGCSSSTLGRPDAHCGRASSLETGPASTRDMGIPR